MCRMNALLLERLLRTPPFAKLACDATSAHAKLAGRLHAKLLPRDMRSYITPSVLVD